MTRGQTFTSEASSVAAARRFAHDAIAGVPAAVSRDVALMVSELATNVVKHTPTASFDLAVDRTGEQIRVEVTDDGGGVPTLRPFSPDALDGRGLQIVDHLATEWGATLDSDRGTTVWFSLALASPGVLVLPAHHDETRRPG